jgi:hypothetical protein
VSAAADDDLLAMIRYLRLGDQRWVRARTLAAVKLLRLPGRGERRRAVLHDARWRSHSDAKLLLILAEEELATPARSAELALLAAAVAARVSPSPLTAMDDLRGTALLALARAFRHGSRYRQADRALAAAALRGYDPVMPIRVSS